jgi:hypothetical protein
MPKTIIYVSVITLLLITFQTHSHAWPIPHSGQTKCYDNKNEIPCPKPGEPFYGQSGNYIINPKSFTKLDDHGNDLPNDAEDWLMVRDNVTGLIWEVKQAKDNIQDYTNPHDSDNTYTWYDTNPENNYGYTGTYNDGKNTEQFIKQINEARFGGFGDWRLPSFKDLASLAALERYLPAINQFYFRGIQCEDWWSAFYWSSTSYAGNTGLAWGVSFHDGYDDDNARDSSYFVRAVRGGQCRSFDHLVINADQTVTDTSTGLIWSVDTSETAMNWEMALTYCENNSLADYSDWRLPEREELRSIVGYSMYNPAINTKYFQTMSAFYWSSTSYARYTGSAWGVHFYNGNAHYGAKDSSYFVRAVRGGQCRSFGHLIIWSPMQADILITGTSLPISWDTSTIKGNVNIFLSRQGGKSDTFETIISETANDGHYDWTITGPPSPNCMLKIEPVSFPYSGTQQSFFTIKKPDMIINTNVQSHFSISGPESFTGTGSSQTIANALPGTYTITYDPLTCWQTPANESQSLTYWGTLNFSGIYGQTPAEPIRNLRADREIKTWTGNNQITIQWKPINQCLKGYAFVWDQHEHTEPADIITETNPQTTSPPLADDDDHWFHIKAINIHGNASETVHIGPFYIDTSMLPDTPENLMIKTSTEDSVQLGWTPAPDTSVYYTIYRSQMENGIYYPIHSEPINYFDAIVNGFWDTDIESDTTYFYKIKSSRDGLESLNFSNSVHFTSPEKHPTFDMIFMTNKHQIVPAGTDITFQMIINITEAFQGHLDIWCENLPEHVSYALSVNHQSATTRAETIDLLPAILNLTIKTGSATLIGDHQFDLLCLNVDSASGYEQKKWPFHLTVVPLTGGIFVDIDPYQIHQNDLVSVSGRIYHFKKNQAIKLEAWKDDQQYASTQLTTQLGGWFEDHEWISHFEPGIYTIKAIWENTGHLPFTDESRSLIIENIRPQLFLSSQENQMPEIDKEFSLSIQLTPSEGYETIKLMLYPPNSAQHSVMDLSTNETGQVNISKNFFNEKGKHLFKAYFMGNETRIGCESNEYAVMVGNTGYAILIGGGMANANNTYWEVTKKLLTDAYLDFKKMGFTDDMIYLMINSEIDITGDSFHDNVVDQANPSVSELVKTIETQYSDLLTESETLYLYMMGHGTNNATFKVFGADESITSEDLNTALNHLQEKTKCTVVIILECCYSGTFIQPLRHPKRLIITSAGEEPYNTDASGNISLSRFLFPRLCKGDSIQKAFEYARLQLINKRYPSPQLDDYTEDNLFAATIYLPEKLSWVQPEIASVDLYPILEGTNTLSVNLTIESNAESISKVWAQVIQPDALIQSGSDTIHFQESILPHVQGTQYSGDVTGFSHDGIYTVIFYAQNTSLEVSEPVQWIVRAVNIGRKTDYNQDGLVNMMDLILVLKSLSGMNGLDEVNLSDAIYVMQEIGRDLHCKSKKTE